ncbi:hypothetical protein GTH52_01305 [Clostridium tyrobutyricum]|nr:hypothetical protein GTH52_01305 [Clostridium tyrobutyricum]
MCFNCNIQYDVGISKGQNLWGSIEYYRRRYLQALDGLPENKVHCSNLGVSALRNAIEDYLNKNRMEDPYENSNSSR